MTFRLIDRDWQAVIVDSLKADHEELRVVCPFIKRRAAERLLAHGKLNSIRVLTRFNLGDFYAGVSDTAALRLLLEHRAEIRGIRNLHAKLYLFGNHRAIVTSANLTEAALTRNHEFGFVADDPAIVGTCADYFQTLWDKAGPNLTAALLDGWDAKLKQVRASAPGPIIPAGLGDEGVDAGIPAPPPAVSPVTDETIQWFVKFFGKSQNRVDRSMLVIEEIRRSGSHWACTYPSGKRPRQVRDGAIMFLARMVNGPDILIYGRAVGVQHRPGQDDATPEDLKLRPWKADWPHYIRVAQGEFVAGTLANGVSLNGLMTALGSDAFVSTRKNARQGSGNTDPRLAYRQKPAVRLTSRAFAWLNKALEQAFAHHGKQPAAELEKLDWPRASAVKAGGGPA